VLLVNRQILFVTLALVLFMVLFTSTLLFVVSDEAEREANGMDSIPDAMYLAVLMLTGQGGPEGDLSDLMKLVTVCTAFLSVPFFAVPSAMLTWGFEGEAQRLATKERRRAKRKQLYGQQAALQFSSSSSESDGLNEYLEEVGGSSDDEGRAEAEAKALHFFKEAKPTLSALPPGAESPGRHQRSKRTSHTAGDAVAQSPVGDCALTAQATQLARELAAIREARARSRQQRKDALVLIERAGEEISPEELLCIEAKMRTFARTLVSEVPPSDTGDCAEVGMEAVQQEVRMLRTDMEALRGDMYAAFAGLKAELSLARRSG